MFPSLDLGRHQPTEQEIQAAVRAAPPTMVGQLYEERETQVIQQEMRMAEMRMAQA